MGESSSLVVQDCVHQQYVNKTQAVPPSKSSSEVGLWPVAASAGGKPLGACWWATYHWPPCLVSAFQWRCLVILQGVVTKRHHCLLLLSFASVSRPAHLYMMVYHNEIIFPGLGSNIVHWIHLNSDQKSWYWFLGFHPCDHFQQLFHNRSWCCTGVCVAAIGLWELQILAGHCRCCSLVQLADLLRIYWFLCWIWFIHSNSLNFVSFRFKVISIHSCNPKPVYLYIHKYILPVLAPLLPLKGLTAICRGWSF